jgi:hypothetical protein
MKISIGIFIVILSFIGIANAVEKDSPKVVVENFLSWEKKVKPSGAYKEELTGAIKELLSPKLMCLLNSAAVSNDISERLWPGDKPPFTEGNLYLPSAWERPLESTIIAVQEQGRKANVEVQFTYAPDAEHFVSIFSVNNISGKWRIVDIRRGGTCDFCQSGSLLKALNATLKSFPTSGVGKCKNDR